MSKFLKLDMIAPGVAVTEDCLLFVHAKNGKSLLRKLSAHGPYLTEMLEEVFRRDILGLGNGSPVQVPPYYVPNVLNTMGFVNLHVPGLCKFSWIQDTFFLNLLDSITRSHASRAFPEKQCSDSLYNCSSVNPRSISASLNNCDI